MDLDPPSINVQEARERVNQTRRKYGTWNHGRTACRSCPSSQAQLQSRIKVAAYGHSGRQQKKWELGRHRRVSKAGGKGTVTEKTKNLKRKPDA